MPIVYLLIAFFATTLGTLAGLGGGVIIKPALDALGDYNVFVIGVLSSTTVLSMALVSTVRGWVNRHFRMNRLLVLIAIGSIAGGVIGKWLFELIMNHTSSERLTSIQAILIIVLLQFALFKDMLPRRRLENMLSVLILGIILGLLSAFLGIGGGPINVAVLCMFFSMDIKQAAAGSIFIILFSQAAKLASIMLTIGFGPYDYSILLYMITAGTAGGLIGPVLRRNLSRKTVEIIFVMVVVSVVLLNVYNVISLHLQVHSKPVSVGIARSVPQTF